MNIWTTEADILKTKQHFEILDGLRGVAALCVVIFHFMEFVYSDYAKNFIGHGFLAVDFFFCLSGFVIAYAYDSRIAKMGLKEFFAARLIRLHPLVILGSVLGLIGFLFDPFSTYRAAYGAGQVLLFFLCSIFVIPYPMMTERAFNLFSFNAPAWSLFWEYAANIVYAVILCKVGRRTSIVLLVISAAVLAYMGYHEGNMMGGWSGSTFWDGAVRVSYSFLAGLVVFRFNLILKTNLGFAGTAILLLAALFMPYFKMNWLVEVMIVLLYFPILVALGAGAALTKGVEKLCNFSGKMSYPLYMTHYFAIWIFGNYYGKYKPKGTELFMIVFTGISVLIGLAYLVMRFYDTPLRKFLGDKRKLALISGKEA